jgi:2-(3-amino-3-carboxypropyl)histidine synthase
MRTLFIEAHLDVDIISAIIPNLHKIMKYKKIGLFTTVQHIKQFDAAKRFLEKNGVKVFINSSTKASLEQGPKSAYCGQLLGCDSSAARSMKVDAFVYIGTGEFHPLAISIETDKPVFKINPFTKKLDKIENSARYKFLAKQAARLANLQDAKKVGIILSTKPGQYKPNIAKKLQKKFLNSALFITDMITSQSLLDFSDIDAWINTACPRLVEDRWPKLFVNADEIIKSKVFK